MVICGAGIAGVSTAFFLAKAGVKDILLVDERPPLTLTSQHSTECYRNAWPQPAMRALMDRSIDWLERLDAESLHRFRLNRRGYLYVVTQEDAEKALLRRAHQLEAAGVRPLRVQETIRQIGPGEKPRDASGADLFLGREVVSHFFPYLNPEVCAALYIHRAGWMSAQQLGMYLFEQARMAGVRFLMGRVSRVRVERKRVLAVVMGDGTGIETPCLVNAAGPMLAEINALLGESFPLFTELHQKVAFHDVKGVVPRHAPLLILDEPQYLPWTDEEAQALREDERTQDLTGLLPGGAHLRPEGGEGSDVVLMLWEYREQRLSPRWPLPLDPLLPEVILRGLTRLLPGLREYWDHLPQPQVDGGYYTLTPDHLALIGPGETQGFYLIGALGGYGIMAACGAGELLAQHILGIPVPEYAEAFLPERFARGQVEIPAESGKL
uniref:FAD dependent oxidoreductase n=1 Tax=uncultured Chloroflexota bacterium TaxID=166587 RepID=H5SFN7_9CHLR|nr:FAD dependent oxidoreductase [uncultured Chloroflexota bacterium]